MLGIYRLDEDLLASQEGLCSMELVVGTLWCTFNDIQGKMLQIRCVHFFNRFESAKSGLFKGLTARRLYKSFSVKGLITQS
jgi:hypothetical protein